MGAGSGSYHWERTPICIVRSPGSMSREWFASQSVPPFRSATDDNHRDRPEHNLKVEPKAQVIDVIDVVREAFLPREPVSSINLGQTREARPNLMTAALRLVIQRQIRRRERTWTDETHIPRKNIYELRQFIEATAP